jgi:hypothetical protein
MENGYSLPNLPICCYCRQIVESVASVEKVATANGEVVVVVVVVTSPFLPICAVKCDNRLSVHSLRLQNRQRQRRKGFATITGKRGLDNCGKNPKKIGFGAVIPRVSCGWGWCRSS